MSSLVKRFSWFHFSNVRIYQFFFYPYTQNFVSKLAPAFSATKKWLHLKSSRHWESTWVGSIKDSKGFWFNRQCLNSFYCTLLYLSLLVVVTFRGQWICSTGKHLCCRVCFCECVGGLCVSAYSTHWYSWLDLDIRESLEFDKREAQGPLQILLANTFQPPSCLLPSFSPPPGMLLWKRGSII